MTETQIKKEILKIIGQEDLKNYFDYTNQDTKDRIIDSIFDVLCITEDDVEEDEEVEEYTKANDYDRF